MANDEASGPIELFEDLDRTGPVPLYFQVSSRLEAAIRSGDIPPGARLENEIAIGQRLGLSRPTIRRAIQELVDKGLLVRRRGIGTQVVQGQVTRQVELTSLYEDLQNSQPRADAPWYSSHEMIPATDEVATAPGRPCRVRRGYVRRRQRSTDGVAGRRARELPARRVRGHHDRAAAGTRASTRSCARGASRFASPSRSIGARRAHGDESELLDIDKDGPVLTMERTAFDSSGRAIEYGLHSIGPTCTASRRPSSPSSGDRPH